MMTMPDEHQNEDLPRIWYSRFLDLPDSGVLLNYALERPKIDLVNEAKEWQPIAPEDAPEFLFFHRENTSIPKSKRDAFQVSDRVVVVSPKLRDVLVQFDLGKTGLFEVPIYMSEAQEPSPYPPHYVLHVAETKPTFVPEESQNVKQGIRWDETEPRPGAKWTPDSTDCHLAVRASSAKGVDLWADPILHRRIFLSDRLKTAIDAARIKTKGFEFIAAKVIA